MYILASASPRRQELLKLITDDFKILPSGADETVPEGIPIFEQPEYLSRIKALSVSKDFSDDIIIGADTSVIAEGKILGKPENKENAAEMLRLLSGKTHSVVTGCAVCKNGECRSFSVESKVEFFCLTEKEIEEYVLTEEPFDKAGAYGIQGKGALFVKRISGDYFNVVGLPVAPLSRFLKNI